MRNLTNIPLIVLLSCGVAFASATDVPNFNRDIRPILSENCFLCHGQDPKHRGGDLRLDLTGLPPSPADIDDFLADTAPDRRDRV